MSEYIRTQGVELLSAVVFSLLFFHAGRLYERMKHFKRELELLRRETPAKPIWPEGKYHRKPEL